MAPDQQFVDDSGDSPWLLLDAEYIVDPHYDVAIVRALRRLDPAIMPLWCIKTYQLPTWRIVDVGRHLIARYIAQPRGVTRTGRAASNPAHIWVDLPHPLPPELRGLPRGPYLEAELLEGESQDRGASPGPYEPMTWDLVHRLEAATWALRNHSLKDLNLQRIHRRQRNKERRQRDAEDLRRQRVKEAARLLDRTLGRMDWVYNNDPEPESERVRVGAATMSARLAGLRKAAGLEEAGAAA